MATPFFVAEAPTVTVLRSLASSAYGSYTLNLPEGIELEDVTDLDAPGNTLGYVASLQRGKRVGGLARSFIRADVTVTAVDPSDPDVVPESDVHDVLDEARARVSSDFFLESDITKAGMGAWIPYVDFNVGDRANISVLDHVVNLPITRIESQVTDHSDTDFLVHVGGQLVSDEQARMAENMSLEKKFLQDRRELAGIEAAAKQAQKTADGAKSSAESAGETADDAQNRSKKINLSLTGDEDKLIEEAVAERTGVVGEIAKTADEADALSKLMDLDLSEAVQTVAEGLDIEVPEGKENRMVFSIAQLLALAIQANARAIRAETDARNLLEREATRMVWADREKAVENADIRLSNPKMSRFTNIVALGTWTGVIVLHTVTRTQEFTGIGVINVDEPWQRHYVVTESNRSFSHDNEAGPAVLHSTVFYQKWAPGKDAVEIENEA